MQHRICLCAIWRGYTSENKREYSWYFTQLVCECIGLSYEYKPYIFLLSFSFCWYRCCSFATVSLTHSLDSLRVRVCMHCLASTISWLFSFFFMFVSIDRFQCNCHYAHYTTTETLCADYLYAITVAAKFVSSSTLSSFFFSLFNSICKSVQVHLIDCLYFDWYHQLSVEIKRNKTKEKQTNSLSFYVRRCVFYFHCQCGWTHFFTQWTRFFGVQSFVCVRFSLSFPFHVIDVYYFYFVFSLVADEKLSCAFVDTIWTQHASVCIFYYDKSKTWKVHANDFNLNGIYFELISIINSKWLMWHSARHCGGSNQWSICGWFHKYDSTATWNCSVNIWFMCHGDCCALHRIGCKLFESQCVWFCMHFLEDGEEEKKIRRERWQNAMNKVIWNGT